MKRKLSLFVFLTIVFLTGIPLVSKALSLGSFNIWEGTETTTTYRNENGTLTIQRKTCNIAGSCSLCNALQVVQNIIDILFQIAIPLAVIFIVYGGIRLMTSGGSQQNVSAAKGIIINAVVGLVIALLAWVIVNVIISLIAVGDFSGWNSINCI